MHRYVLYFDARQLNINGVIECDRRFEPDRLITHMKGCKSNDAPKNEAKASPARSPARATMVPSILSNAMQS
jgi:hypothetical protein